MRLMFRFTSLVTVVIIGLLTAVTTATGATTSGRSAVRSTATITTWSRRYDGGEQPGPMAVSRDGSKLFITGIPQKGEAGTIAYNAVTGAALWHAPYPGDANDLAVNPAGSTLFITGSAGTAAYDAVTGAVRWTNASAPGTSIAVSPNGSTVFTANWDAHLPGYVISAYAAASGASMWTSSYRSAGLSAGAYVTLSPDGTRVFMLGSSGDFGAYITFAYDASTGARLWVQRYRGPGRKRCRDVLRGEPGRVHAVRHRRQRHYRQRTLRLRDRGLSHRYRGTGVGAALQRPGERG